MQIDHADLLDSHEVAQALGLGSHRAVSVYRSRYDDFPTPIIEKGAGRCVLWRRQDIEAWAQRKGKR
jgi:predicted DNA-binding transcriptional regulator AlpA